MAFRLLLAAAALLAAVPANAQAGWWRSNSFEIDRDDAGCTMHRSDAATDRARVSWRGQPGGVYVLTIGVRGGRFKPGRTYRLRLTPAPPNTGPAKVEGEGTGFRDGEWSAVRIPLTARDPSDALFNYRELLLTDVTRRPRRIGVVPALGGGPLGAYLRCLAELSARDRGSSLPAVSPPSVRGRLESLMTLDDYPPAAIRAEEQGLVRLRLVISAKGRVSDCRIVRSSGSPVLDETSCALLSRRARFFPAIDANGDATEGVLEQGIEWTLPPAWLQ